jgi:hypothetical protein
VGFHADSIEISNSVIKELVDHLIHYQVLVKQTFYHGVMVNPPNVNLQGGPRKSSPPSVLHVSLILC